MSAFQPFVAGAVGNNVGAGAVGVLVGALTPIAPSAALLKSANVNALAYTDDGGLYANVTTNFASVTANDVNPLPATPAVDDAFYVGHANETFAEVKINGTTQGVGVWTIAWEYWNGAAWVALAGVTDGTTGFTAAVGIVSVSFTKPAEWEKCTVDGVLGYWVRARVSAYTSVATQPKLGYGHVVTAEGSYTDQTGAFAEGTAGDVMLLPSVPVVGDAFLIGHTERFTKAKIVTSQARTGTATVVLKYWNGTAWVALPTVVDETTGLTATAGTKIVHFVPPADWAELTVGSKSGFFISIELTELTSMTAQPLATQGWVYPLSQGASGVKSPIGGSYVNIDSMAKTVSGSAADSVFVLVNCTQGKAAGFTWTKATAFNSVASVKLDVAVGDKLAIVQITEDGATEFADVQFFVSGVAF